MKTLVRSLIFILINLSLFACNPVKQVLKSETKTREVVDSFIVRNPIKNDTLIKYLPGKTDSVPVYLHLRDTLREKVPCDSFTKTTSKGTTVSVDKKGNLTVKNDSLKTYKYVRIDTLERLIKDRTLLLQAQDLARRQSIQLAEKDQQIKAFTAKIFKLKAYLWGIVVLIVLFIAFKIYKRFSGFMIIPPI